MLCEKILGRIEEEEFKNLMPDYVDFEWHETYSKLHRKHSRQGRDIAISLDDSILKKGIKPGDVLAKEEGKVIVADVLPTEILSASCEKENPLSLVKIAYEIGNNHAPLFGGKKEGELITIFNEPMERLLKSLPHVKVEKRTEKLDFSRQISSIVGHSHHHHSHEEGHHQHEG